MTNRNGHKRKDTTIILIPYKIMLKSGVSIFLHLQKWCPRHFSLVLFLLFSFIIKGIIKTPITNEIGAFLISTYFCRHQACQPCMIKFIRKLISGY